MIHVLMQNTKVRDRRGLEVKAKTNGQSTNRWTDTTEFIIFVADAVSNKTRMRAIAASPHRSRFRPLAVIGAARRDFLLVFHSVLGPPLCEELDAATLFLCFTVIATGNQ